MHPIIDTLKAQRATAWEVAKTLLDGAEAEKRDLNAEESAQFAAINADLDAKDARIAEVTKHEKRAEVADAIRDKVERAATEQPETVRAIKREEDEVRSFLNGERRTFQSEVTEPVARWLSKNPAERRDTLTSSTGAPVPTSFADRLTMHLVQIGPMWDTSEVLRTASGENIQFPRTTAHGAATFKAQGSELDETNPTFGAFITLGAWKYGTFQQYSMELLSDSGIDLLGYIADQGATSIAVVTNTAFTTGNDTNAPNGIVPASTLGVTGAAGTTGAFTADNLLELLYSVGPQYRRLPSSGWQMRDASILACRKLKDGNGQYIFVPGITAGEPDRLLGYPLYSNPDVVATALSAKSVIYGALAKYMIRQAGAVRFERSDEFAFTSDLATFKIVIRVDGDLLDTTGAVKHFIGNAA
jgi:HK97 family phage major capsid protein